jgi:hypothetical protein
LQYANYSFVLSEVWMPSFKVIETNFDFIIFKPTIFITKCDFIIWKTNVALRKKMYGNDCYSNYFHCPIKSMCLIDNKGRKLLLCNTCKHLKEMKFSASMPLWRIHLYIYFKIYYQIWSNLIFSNLSYLIIDDAWQYCSAKAMCRCWM